ncbi:MAG: hypothetical protein ACP5D8_06240 [Fidelibacterota bacterium]
MKPIIIVCGVPHSFTSMVSKFLLDNGAWAKETWDNPKWEMGYSRFEDEEIQNFLKKRKNFRDYNLSEYFASFPSDQVAMLKAPQITFFLNELKKYTHRELKVVYVIRNPEQIILSSMEKGKKSFIYYFERIVWMYRFMAQCEYEVFPLIAERLEKEASKLLDFCELKPKEINISSLKKRKERSATYVKYRFSNFLWKRMARLFRVI